MVDLILITVNRQSKVVDLHADNLKGQTLPSESIEKPVHPVVLLFTGVNPANPERT
jgi:hypothetical protein